MRVLSLFDGISGARQALKELNIDCDYYASEIDKYAITIAQKNHPDIIQMGDVRNVGGSVVDIDLLIGGSPCQDLSIAGKGRGLSGERSGLFFEYVRILNQSKPKYFILENVASMKKEARDQISNELFQIEPILINSSLLTAQSRKRLYWVGELQKDGNYKKVEINQPENKGILLKDVLEDLPNYSEQYCLREKSKCLRVGGARSPLGSKQEWDSPLKPLKISEIGNGGQGNRIYSVNAKAICLNAQSGGLGAKTGLYQDSESIRRLSPVECERLQGFPDNYTLNISTTQRYKVLGNSFTVPVIKHLLSTIFKN